MELGPLVDTSKSDSANLDSILELYNRAGKSPQEAVSILVPPAWENGRIEDQLEALRASGGDDASVRMKRGDVCARLPLFTPNPVFSVFLPFSVLKCDFCWHICIN